MTLNFSSYANALCTSISQHCPREAGRRGSDGQARQRSSSNVAVAIPARESSSEGIAATLRSIQQQLSGLKQEVKEIRGGPSAAPSRSNTRGGFDA